MQIVESYMTKNPCYTAGKKINVKGLMLHSVGCSQPDAQVFIQTWNKQNYTRACVHAFIDGNTGVVYQTLPWDHRGWHSASGSKGSANNTHIGVEMCEPKSIHYVKGSTFTCADAADAKASVKRTYDAAVELFAQLCKEYALDPLQGGVIISHAEGYKRGIASGHADPEHLWSGLDTGYTMDGFRADVRKAMGETTLYRVRRSKDDAAAQIGAFKALKLAKDMADVNPGYKVFDCSGTLVYEPEYAVYTVVKGDSLWKIAKRFLGSGLKYPQIRKLNALTTDVIHVGQKLKIPNNG